jgi:hypothetical protein
VTATWESGGWTIKAAYTNPNPVAGSTIGLVLTETYEIDGIPATTAPTDVTASLAVGANVINKYWTTKTALTSLLNLEAPVSTPEGEVKIQTDGTLRIKVVAPNDSISHFVTFRLVYRSPLRVVMNNLLDKNKNYRADMAAQLVSQFS